MKVAPGTRPCSEVKPFCGQKVTTPGCKQYAACKEYRQAEVNDNLKIWGALTCLSETVYGSGEDVLTSFLVYLVKL